MTRGLDSGDKLIKIILAVNIAMFVISLLIQPRAIRFSMNPLGFLAPGGESLIALGETGSLLMNGLHGWWTLISANYPARIHPAHLFQYDALTQVSHLITQLYGSYRYFLIYTISGVGGFFVSYLAGIPLTIGASAALCGLIGAALYYGKDRGGPFGQAVYKQIGGWALTILLFGFMIPGINNWAHIGGMAFGAATGFLLGYHEKKREDLYHRIAAAVCMVLTAGVLLWSLFRGVLFLLVS